MKENARYGGEAAVGEAADGCAADDRTCSFGYARVSSREQNPARQLDALTSVGIAPSRIFVDRQSGKDFDRPEYLRCVGAMREGDVLFVESVDRLGRDYDEIREQWRALTYDRKIDIVVLDMPLLDTRRKRDGLTGKFIADMVLQVLSYVAETERQNIRKRQAEGIASALERGVRFGRRPLPVPNGFTRVCRHYLLGDLSARKAAHELGVSPQTFMKWVEEATLDEKRMLDMCQGRKSTDKKSVVFLSTYVDFSIYHGTLRLISQNTGKASFHREL